MVELAMAAFDESGKLNDSEIVAFGGCVATQEQWGSFCSLWAKFIEPLGLSHISMKDAIHFHGPFASWKKRIAERDELLRSLAKLITSTDRVSARIRTSQFKKLPREIQKHSGNAQYHGFESCVRLAYAKLPESTTLLIECDLSEEYAKPCLELFQKLRRNPEFKNRCISILFSDDRFRAPLQAADMVSYCSRAEELRNTLAPKPIVEELIKILASSKREQFGYKSTTDELGRGMIQA